LAKEEAARLLNNPPKVIIYLPKTEAQSLNEEAVWRNDIAWGKEISLPQSKLLPKAIASPLSIPPSRKNQDVYVYVRPDSPALDSK